MKRTDYLNISVKANFKFNKIRKQNMHYDFIEKEKSHHATIFEEIIKGGNDVINNFIY